VEKSVQQKIECLCCRTYERQQEKKAEFLVSRFESGMNKKRSKTEKFPFTSTEKSVFYFGKWLYFGEGGEGRFGLWGVSGWES
jgi:hypothetical protein